MPKPYPPELVHYLLSSGVNRVIVGHTPHGNCPTVIPHGEGLTVIMADTSFSQMKSNLAYLGDNRGDAVCDIAIGGSQGQTCLVRGTTGDSAARSGDRGTVNYSVPGSENGDHRIGMVQPASESVAENERFFVKAFLPALEGKDARYLLCKVDGYINTYQKEPAAEVDRVFLGSKGIELNDTTMTRVTSHGDVEPVPDDIVEHVFRRIDLDHDGKVTQKELVAACSKKEVREALLETFPGTSLEETFTTLDADNDGQVSLDEFREKMKGLMLSPRGELRRGSWGPPTDSYARRRRG